MKRLPAIVCMSALAAATLAGCGSDSGGGDSDSASGGDYCSQVEEMKGGFDELSGGDSSVADLRSTVDLVGDISGEAPSDVSDEWDSLHTTMDDVVSQLEDIGLATDKPLQDAAKAFVKENPGEAQKMMGAFEDVQTNMAKIKSDGEAIEAQVKDECDIELGS